MKTEFSLKQLADPNIAEMNSILRACVHCGFCTATCPTYTLLGDESDSPRGRIYQIKEMLEHNTPAPKNTVKHIDRCLSCLSCMTTCPSDVHYMHLVDYARTYIEKTHTRPLLERIFRRLLGFTISNPGFFRIALIGAMTLKPLAKIMTGSIGAIFKLAPKSVPQPSWADRPQVFPALGTFNGRVALMNGCAQQVLAPEINEATVRLLTRQGFEVVVSKDSGCCGALSQHLGHTNQSHKQAEANIRSWGRELICNGLDAIIINASGCGTMVKDYGFIFRNNTDHRDTAIHISSITKDITEFLATLDLSAAKAPAHLKIAYHSACSMQHGQNITNVPKELLSKVGFEVLSPAEAHLCCGSAGVYNLLQPDLAERLKTRKLKNIEATNPDIIATGNIGCITQLAAGSGLPIMHTVELLDWATGGPRPKSLKN